MKTILCLFAVGSILLGTLATLSALVWDDTQLAIGAVVAASVLAGFALVGEIARQSKAVTQ